MAANTQSVGFPKRIPFKVDIAGVIEIMGTSLYSSPNTPIRELLQNAHDAIMRRRAKDLTIKGESMLSKMRKIERSIFGQTALVSLPKKAEEYLGTLGIGITGLIKKGFTPKTLMLRRQPAKKMEARSSRAIWHWIVLRLYAG